MPYDSPTAPASATAAPPLISGLTSDRENNPAAASAPAAYRGPRDWRRRYASLLRLTDLLVLVWVVYGTQIA
ncbi:hypothetical protein [Microbacterium arborescens]